MKRLDHVLQGLIDGKLPKDIAAELGVTRQAITWNLAEYRKATGCKTIYQAIARYVREKK